MANGKDFWSPKHSYPTSIGSDCPEGHTLSRTNIWRQHTLIHSAQACGSCPRCISGVCCLRVPKKNPFLSVSINVLPSCVPLSKPPSLEQEYLILILLRLHFKNLPGPPHETAVETFKPDFPRPTKCGHVCSAP